MNTSSRIALAVVVALALTAALVMGMRSCQRQRQLTGQTQTDALRRPPVALAVEAIAAQSDPAKLATLGRRQANPLLKRIVFYLAQARDAGADPTRVIEAAQRVNGSAGTPRQG